MFLTVGKLDVNKRQTHWSDPLRGSLGECVGVIKEGKMVNIQSLRHEIKVSSVIHSFSKPFDNYIIECWLYASLCT